MFAKYAPLSMRQSPAQSAKNSPQVSAKNSPQVSPPGSPQVTSTVSGNNTPVVFPATQLSAVGRNISELSQEAAESPFVSAKNSPALSLKNSQLHKAKVGPNVSATRVRFTIDSF